MTQIEDLEKAILQKPNAIPWWVLQELKHLGYVFKQISTTSYKLVASPPVVQHNLIHAALTQEGKELFLHQNGNDTSILYKRWVNPPAPPAEEQPVPLTDGVEVPFDVALTQGACSICGKILMWEQHNVKVGTNYSAYCCLKEYQAFPSTLVIQLRHVG